MMFGGITIICGIFGTLAGGFILDRMSATISNAFKVNSHVLKFNRVTPYLLPEGVGDVE